MNNMTEYLRWRGDVPFEAMPISEADYLVFSQLAYLPFDGIVGEEHSSKIKVGIAAEIVLKRLSEGQENTLLIFDDNISFLKELIRSPRFSELYLCGYSNIYSTVREEQFSAVTFLIPSDKPLSRAQAVIAFRGTDSTLVGWKEDFNMAFEQAVPAQLDAVNYIEKTAAALPAKKLCVCGHSKGGNLAVYGSAFCRKKVQDRIVAVRNLDGPGFSKTVTELEGFVRIMGRTKTIVPDSSVVGILLEYSEDLTVIRSYAAPTYQHNPFTWEIQRDGYVVLESISDVSMYIDSTLKDFIASMTPDLREKMINGIYDVLVSANILDVRELISGKNIIGFLRGLKNLDPETRAVLIKGFELFRKAAKTNLPSLIEKLKNSHPHTKENT